jgi:IS30 family transposase
VAHYQQLNLMEREELSRRLAAGHSLLATALALNRAPGTLSRELARHGTSPVTYRAVAAHQRAQRRAHYLRKPRTLAVHSREE